MKNSSAQQYEAIKVEYNEALVEQCKCSLGGIDFKMCSQNQWNEFRYFFVSDWLLGIMGLVPSNNQPWACAFSVQSNAIYNLMSKFGGLFFKDTLAALAAKSILKNFS